MNPREILAKVPFFAETLDEDGPALLHVRIAPEANCLPMFRPGGAAREMIG